MFFNSADFHQISLQATRDPGETLASSGLTFSLCKGCSCDLGLNTDSELPISKCCLYPETQCFPHRERHPVALAWPCTRTTLPWFHKARFSDHSQLQHLSLTIPSPVPHLPLNSDNSRLFSSLVAPLDTFTWPRHLPHF